MTELAKKGKKRQISNKYTYNQRELSTHHTFLSQKNWQKEVGAHRTIYYAGEQKKNKWQKEITRTYLMPNSNTQPIPWGIDPPHVVELPNLNVIKETQDVP